jgi:hypothetical protein
MDVPDGYLIIEDADTPLGFYTLWDSPFTDVQNDSWHFGDVEYAFENGLFAGTNTTTFSPTTPMTRGMIVTVLGRLAGADVSGYTTSSFSDVPTGQYYSAFVEWAQKSGIVSGVGAGSFNPDGSITRQDLAVILYRYAQFMEIDLPKKNAAAAFADDADITGYAREALYAMQEAGIISGKPGNLADPQGQATRAEVAAMLHRFVEAIK